MAGKLSKPCPECGASLHVEATKCKCGWQDARAVARQSRIDRFACQAYGCCLPGTLFASGSSSDGWCYMHDAHRESLDITALTRAINMRRALFDALHLIGREVDQIAWWTEIPGRYARPFRDANREQMLPTADERTRTVYGWMARVRRDLEAEILAELGIDVRSGGKRKSERRVYAPSDDDIEAAQVAQRAIEDGTWRAPADLLRAAA